LLSLIGAGHFEHCLSVPLVLEYEDVLLRHLENIGPSREQVGDILDFICDTGAHQDVFYLWRPLLKDPKDDMLLELAVAARCHCVVTFNVKDFVGSETFGMRIRRPRDFLAELGAVS
jgi:predicted nucleic acid-binding protein